MSRFYEMYVEVSSFDKNKVFDVFAAMDDEWPWDDEEDYPSSFSLCISRVGKGNLCAGETEEQFVKKLTHAVWQANGSYCNVFVTATCLENLPCNAHECGEDEYKEWFKSKTKCDDSTML